MATPKPQQSSLVTLRGPQSRKVRCQLDLATCELVFRSTVRNRTVEERVPLAAYVQPRPADESGLDLGAILELAQRC